MTNENQVNDTPLVQFPITKEMIETLPQKARRTFLMAGAIANDMAQFHRLVLFTFHDYGNRAVNVMAHGQGWVILRIPIGKTFEAHRFIETHLKASGEFYDEYLKGPFTVPTRKDVLGEEYLLTSYDRVWARINASRGLLRQIRNRHSFHYDLKPYLEEGLAALEPDWDTSIYMAGVKRHGNFNAFAEHSIVRSMLLLTGEPDTLKAMDDLHNEVTEASKEIWDLMEAILICIITQHSAFDSLKPQRIATVSAPRFLDLKIPPVCSD